MTEKEWEEQPKRPRAQKSTWSRRHPASPSTLLHAGLIQHAYLRGSSSSSFLYIVVGLIHRLSSQQIRNILSTTMISEMSIACWQWLLLCLRDIDLDCYDSRFDLSTCSISLFSSWLLTWEPCQDQCVPCHLKRTLTQRYFYQVL